MIIIWKAGTRQCNLVGQDKEKKNGMISHCGSVTERQKKK